ncbi:MAG: AmmeMemoRadiSam system protein B [bacterium]|nr:AmmeMemoRadiSam system protein B [bacterium]
MKAQYSGILYEKEYMPLLHQIHRTYTHRLGPGEMPGKRKDTERVYGILVPHSPYALAGPGMAWGYKLLSEHYFPETYVFLIPDTQGLYDKVMLVNESIETLFGVCSVDSAFADALLATTLVSSLKESSEFALEIQIPFLQEASRDRLKVLKIIPLIVPVCQNLPQLAEALVKIKKDIVVIIASDLCGGSFVEDVDGSYFGYDKQLLRYILHFDTEGFAHALEKHKLSLLGEGALVLGMEILKQLAVPQGEILNYYNSSEMASSEAKSFVSLVF